MERSAAGMSPRERRAWLAIVSLSELLPARLDAQLSTRVDLIHFDYSILSMLEAANAQPLRTGHLAAALACPNPKLSKALARLEKRGLVERSPGEIDRRAIHITLTAAGRELWRDATPVHDALARDELLASLNDEQLDTLTDLLDTVLERLDPARALRGICDGGDAHPG